MEKENSKLQVLQGQEGGGERVWSISEQIQGTTGHHGAKAEGCQRHCFTVTQRNEQVVFVPDEGQESFKRDQTSARPNDRLFQSRGGIGCSGGQDLRCVNQIPWGQKKLACISPFQDYLIIPRSFI